MEPVSAAKSVGHETTFAEDIGDTRTLERVLLALSEEVGVRLRRAGRCGRTVTLVALRLRRSPAPARLHPPRSPRDHPVAAMLFHSVERHYKVSACSA